MKASERKNETVTGDTCPEGQISNDEGETQKHVLCDSILVQGNISPLLALHAYDAI
jgi:hypothetical protein